MGILNSLAWLVVILVTLLTCSIILLGAAFVLPRTCAGSDLMLVINHAITFMFTFNILFNYAAGGGL